MALSDWLQLRLGSLLADFSVPALGDGGCTNYVTPTASFSLQLVCACLWTCEPQLCTQLSTVTSSVCTHSQRWAQSSLLTVANLWEPVAFLWPSWELFRETVLNKWLPKKSKQWNFLQCQQYFPPFRDTIVKKISYNNEFRKRILCTCLACIYIYCAYMCLCMYMHVIAHVYPRNETCRFLTISTWCGANILLSSLDFTGFLFSHCLCER